MKLIFNVELSGDHFQWILWIYLIPYMCNRVTTTKRTCSREDHMQSGFVISEMRQILPHRASPRWAAQGSHRRPRRARSCWRGWTKNATVLRLRWHNQHRWREILLISEELRSKIMTNWNSRETFLNIISAARMEQTSEALKIQVSDYMKGLVSSYFPNEFKLTPRGEVKVKVHQKLIQICP